MKTRRNKLGLNKITITKLSKEELSKINGHGGDGGQESVIWTDPICQYGLV